MESAPRPNNEATATSQWDSLSNYAGEKNINDKTGKRRTFTEFDLYPKQPGETNEEYGARLKFMHQKTAEYQAEEAAREAEARAITDKNDLRTNNYLESEQGKQELQAEANFDRISEKIEQAIKDGKITEEHAKVLLEKQLDKATNVIDGIRQDYVDRQSVGTPEEQEAYNKWLSNHDEENKKNLEARKETSEEGVGEEQEKHEEQEKLKVEEEEKTKLEEEKKRQLEELVKNEEEKKRLEARLKQIDDELGPLAAINADFTHDKKELAHDIAEQQLNEEQARSNLIKRIWKGGIARKYYQKKYERQLLSGERAAGTGDDGKDIMLDDIIGDRSGSAIRRFVLGATEDMQYIHEKIGKERKDGTYDGEKLTEADAETTNAVRGAIEKFASAKIPEGGSIEDLKRIFGNDIKRIKAEARDQGQNIDATMIDNYLEVAVQARQRVEHGIAMDRVMEGFKVFNADVRNNMRTEAHRDNIDKIINRVESSKIGSVIPAEALAMAVGTAWSLIQTGARSAARIAAPVGGIAVSGALAGLRERNRVTEDRARMMRDAAVGLEYDGMSDEEIRGRRAKKRAKYEARIGGTLYDLRPASELTSNITQALNSGDGEAKLRAIAEARVRIGYSDSEQKDLISYSSADKMGDERTRLDMAVIRAEKSLSEEEKQRLEILKTVVRKEINNDVNENDQDFRKVRAAQAVKQAGKTVLIGSAVFFASQEIMAAIDPNKVGLFEKAGLLKTQNNENAQETILASLAGPSVRTETHVDTIEDISGDRQTEIKQYEQAGYTKVEKTAAWTETKKDLVEVDPSQSTAQVKVEYDGWANNGTSVSDGNELRLYLNNGQITSGMHGVSTMGGEALDYDAAAAAGRVKLYLTIGDSKFEIASKVNSAGELAWGENGLFTTTTGETIQAVSNNGEKLYKYAEIVLDNGKDANGISHIIPFATDLGPDSFSGKIQQVAETTVEHPAMYDFVKTTVTEIPRDISYGGIATAQTSRVGLGGPRTANTVENDNVNQEATLGRNTPPAQSAEQTDTAKAELTERIRRDFGNLVGEDGVNYMSGNTNDNNTATGISQWWNSLNQEAKDAVIDFEREYHPYGTMLRSWLQLNGHIEG